MLVRCRPLARSIGIYKGLYRPHINAQLGLIVRWSSVEKSKTKQLVIPDSKKPSLTTRVVNELKHYYHGFRLLALETRLSMKYLWRLARGTTLTRRERQQLVRTVSDLLRLLPFSFFIIVPFMELALPIFLKFFPGMLPSTFQEASKEQDKIRRQLKARIEMANFLQDTLEEIALERKEKLKHVLKEDM
uniref:Letm1 RBD domain-containing protein n=1 Tax=Ditylenchus dipsaci TaxID=166011 RepID=A0A915CY49_9BILA